LVGVNTIENVRAAGESMGFNPLNPMDYLRWMGPNFALFGVLLIIFAETGLMVGFFFPGDSLLFLTGVAASSAAPEVIGWQIPIIPLLIFAPLCAIAGAQFGHFLGARYGSKLFDKPNSRLFKREYVEKAEHYFQKFGPRKAVVLARFIPIVRTFMNPVAGVLEMPARQFFVWNAVGAIIWTDGILLAAYFFAQQIIDAIGGPDKIDKYILPFVFLIVLVSLIPVFIEVWRTRQEKKRARKAAEHQRIAA
jgi:membrane-associated protein